jgi:predicted O-methyltransferase YrrM
MNVMNISMRARNMQTQFFRRMHLNGIDTIATLQQRHKGFTALRDHIRQLGTDSLSHFGNGYTHEGGLCLQQNPDEFAALCLFLRERAPYTNYLEIGSASGGACLVLSQEVGFTNAFSLDDGQHPRAVEQPKNFRRVPNFKQFIGDSHSTAAVEFLRAELPGKIDLAFIDGDHSYAGVWQDVELTLPFCRPGALIIFHDTIACDGVERAWLRCVRARRLRPLAEYIGAERPLGIAVGAVR